MDSSGSRLLLLVQARSRVGGPRLELRRPSDRVVEVLRICGIDAVLAFSDP